MFTLILGSFVGIIAGYRGGWVDSLFSRVGEIFLGIPLLLGGILFLYVFPSDLETPFILVVGKVALVLGLLGWPSIMRLMRSSVLQVKPNDYVQAARALGAAPGRIITSHILPNSLASVIVVSTINLGRLHLGRSHACPSSASGCSRPRSPGVSRSPKPPASA